MCTRDGVLSVIVDGANTSRMLNNYGFIFLSPDADPVTHRAVIETRGFKTTLVAVPDPSLAPSVAVALLAEGVQLLELCGAFGPTWTSRVLDAIHHRVPVGAVSYGVESVAALSAMVAR
jgi:hypothetical protein